MNPRHLRTLILRDLDTVRREIEAYPDDATVWALPEGVPNAGGTLALHLAGNLHHYIGAVLGGRDYLRDRDGEFGDRDLSRAGILERVAAARRAVDVVLSELDPSRLDMPFPVKLRVGSVNTGLFLMHLAGHLSYHLGQLDYHRRIVTGDRSGVDAQSLDALA